MFIRQKQKEKEKERKELEEKAARKEQRRLYRAEQRQKELDAALELAQTNYSSADSEDEEVDNDPTSNWNLLLPFWPISSRPENLQNIATVNKMDLDKLKMVMAFRVASEKLEGKKDGAEICHNDDVLPTVRYTACKDNGRDKLAEARFERMPVDPPEVWFGKVPKKRAAIFRNLPLEATGTQHSISDECITLMHNRCRVLTIKNLSSENINVAARPLREKKKVEGSNITTTTELAWSQPTSLSQLQECLLNFGIIQQQLYPLDHTGWALQRLMLRYDWLAVIPQERARTTMLSKLFDKIFRQNALKAANGLCPLQFEEMETLLKSLMTNNSGRIDSSFGGLQSNTAPFHQFQQQLNRGYQQQNNYRPSSSSSSKRGPSGPPGNKTATYNGLGVCFGFNTTDPSRPCKNKPNKDHNGAVVGCTDGRGREFVHRCDKIKANGDFCFSSGHARPQHR